MASPLTGIFVCGVICGVLLGFAMADLAMYLGRRRAEKFIEKVRRQYGNLS